MKVKRQSSQLFLIVIPHHYYSLWTVLLLYFISFNILEALFPSMIANAAEPSLKGTATGIYSSAQFLGIFSGGMIAGLLYKYLGTTGIFSLNSFLALGYLSLQQRLKLKTH